MKMLSWCLLSLCVAGTLSSSILLPLSKNAVGKQAVAASDVNNQFRNVANAAHKASQTSAGNKDYGRTNAQQEDAANRASSALQTAANAFASNAANADKYNKDQAASAHKASSAVYNQHNQKSNNIAKTDNVDNVWTANRNFKNGNNWNDNIDYAYDKKFDLNDNQNGAFVEDQNSNVKGNDNFYDRSFAYDRNVDQFAAAASAADKQSNARASSAKANNLANQALRDNFGRNSAQNNDIWANQRAASNKQDSSRNANADSGVLDNQLSGVNQANYAQGNSFKQQVAADKAGYGAGFQANLSPYYKGGNLLATGPGSYGPSLFNPSGGALDFGKYGGGVNYGGANDFAAENQLKNQGQWGLQKRNQDSFNRDIWTNDQFQGIGDKRSAAFGDFGFSNQDKNAAQSSARAEADKAQAAVAKDANQGRSDFNEDLKLVEVGRKANTERNSNNKVYKRFFNNDNRNGNNWERLNYDRNVGDNNHGFDNQFRRDKSLKDVAQKDNVAQSSNGRQADDARAQQAGWDNQYQDWRRANNGFNNAKASSDNADAAAQKQFDNRVWKYDKGQAYGDNLYQKQAGSDQGGNFYNNGRALQGGFAGAAYPYGGGLNFGGFQPGFYY